MGREKQRAKKKKERERKGKETVLKRRAVLRAKAKEENDERKLEKRIKKLKRDMEGYNLWSDEILKKVPASTLAQLEKNVQILKALEAEYENSEEARAERVKELESQGHLTLEEKFNALHQSICKTQQAEAKEAILTDEPAAELKE